MSLSTACRGLAAFVLQAEPCAKDGKTFNAHVNELGAAIQRTIDDWYYETPPAEAVRKQEAS